jgi:hypothetical protein
LFAQLEPCQEIGMTAIAAPAWCHTIHFDTLFIPASSFDEGTLAHAPANRQLF